MIWPNTESSSLKRISLTTASLSIHPLVQCPVPKIDIYKSSTCIKMKGMKFCNNLLESSDRTVKDSSFVPVQLISQVGIIRTVCSRYRIVSHMKHFHFGRIICLVISYHYLFKSGNGPLKVFNHSQFIISVAY
jgi:hypothetical protein